MYDRIVKDKKTGTLYRVVKKGDKETFIKIPGQVDTIPTMGGTPKERKKS